jgi:beta-ureidopropionase
LISSKGEVIGKYRKHHIPPIEKPFISSGDYESPVFETEFGKIGILICYERHFPMKWSILAQKGAEIIFNPSSEDDNSLSERMWFVENLNAAVSCGVFTVSINRCGEEMFGDRLARYFGSSHVSSPFGFVTPHLSQQQQGILITTLDMSVIEKAREEILFHKNQNLTDFIRDLSDIDAAAGRKF